jgi:cystathionine beta-lyase/cystathionine gamma-synthase
MGFATDAVHGGQEPEPQTGAVITPIFQTSTYKQDGIGKHRGYEYSRTHNPTREAYERNVAVLEKAKYAVAFASGMAAIDAVARIFQAGDEIIVTDNVYGGTHRLFKQLLSGTGLGFKFVDTSNLQVLEEAISQQTKLILIETPTNPLLKVTDLEQVSLLARDRGLLMAVDNTFMSPYLQQPLKVGADIVIHSSTKYLNGHSDMIGGVVAVNDDSLLEKLRFIQNAAGAVPGPFDCWLALRGTKTLAVRMKQHEANARILASHLQHHSGIKHVFYPGLPEHPQHQLQQRQANGFGAMITIDTGSLSKAGKVLERVRLFTLAESLGGVESLISHPATMTHGSIPETERLKLGVTDGLVRLSVGIEDVDDLQKDIDQALS